MNPEELVQELACGSPGCGCGRPSGKGWQTHCPSHKDDKPSLTVSVGQNDKLLVHCHAGCSQNEVIETLKKRHLWPRQERTIKKNRANRKVPPKAIEKIYDYFDENGNLLFQVCKFKGKKFRQRRPDGKGEWIWSLDGVRVIPYNLPNLLGAETVFIPEGEKDCEALQQMGLNATCNPMGAGKWRDTFGKYFKDKDVLILPDNDAPGRRHAQDVARHLHGTAKSVKVLELPGLPAKGDVSDWLAKGGIKEELLALAEQTPTWEPLGSGSEKIESGPYRIDNGAILYEKPTRNGLVPEHLCNFSAKIVADGEDLSGRRLKKAPPP